MEKGKEEEKVSLCACGYLNNVMEKTIGVNPGQAISCDIS